MTVFVDCPFQLSLEYERYLLDEYLVRLNEEISSLYCHSRPKLIRKCKVDDSGTESTIIKYTSPINVQAQIDQLEEIKSQYIQIKYPWIQSSHFQD